ncbi:MAG: hypothetical protein EOP83_04170 [Verrucomicrobiaceae bacterium]|nr:MAG: hypothetical protein EOP83_04170 [Verrucomicrobiaceae bacterium]
MPYVTRIAPSPTGMMHVGTARTAIFNWLAARASMGKFILRIDDTDSARNQPEAVQPIIDGLNWLGLRPDETHYQSRRSETYHQYAALLMDDDLAYRAENGAILLRRPKNMPRAWTDSIKGTIPITDRDLELMGDLVLIKGGEKLGEPTYQYASTLDDYLMRVNYIIRGVDHIANTGKQIAVWTALNEVYSVGVMPGGIYPAELPKFAHVGLITKDGKKLSKRDGAASLLDYRDNDYEAEALFAFLVRMGWGPKIDNKENAIIGRDRALELFLDGGNLKSADCGFDQNRLDNLNRKFKGWAIRAAREREAATKQEGV